MRKKVVRYSHDNLSDFSSSSSDDDDDDDDDESYDE